MLRWLVFGMTLLLSPLAAVEPLIVGMTGGTGSGKTTLAKKIYDMFPGDSAVICQDSYYKELNHLPIEVRARTNFDHPDALDFALLAEHIRALKQGQAIDVPIYNYCTHSREQEKERVEPVSIIVVEGILLFAVPEIRDLFDIKIFVQTDDDIRLLRRIERDIKERGREFNSVRDQYIETVKPMHDAFVEPSKRFADVIIPSERSNEMALQVIASKLKEELQTRAD